MSIFCCRGLVTLNSFQGLINEEVPKQVRHDVAQEFVDATLVI